MLVFISDATGLGRTRQKPDLDYFLQTETRTRIFNINPNQTRLLIFDKSKYKNPTKNPNPAEPEAKVQTDPKPEPDWLNPSRSRTRLFETRCVTSKLFVCLFVIREQNHFFVRYSRTIKIRTK